MTPCCRHGYLLPAAPNNTAALEIVRIAALNRGADLAAPYRTAVLVSESYGLFAIISATREAAEIKRKGVGALRSGFASPRASP